MKIDFTEKQYIRLLKVLYLGTWMTDAFNTESSGECDDLEQYVLSFAEGFGLKDHVTYDENLTTYSYAGEFEKSTGARQVINEYDENVFWYELIHRMAKRDFMRAHGVGIIGKMSIEERFEREDQYIKWYEDEFSTNSIENLAVVDMTCICDHNE
ncbi:MAG: hypothetical protein A4E62_00061 [Syntrophorhabdus sp. PtaU1.Bin002]|nr:MAG: hypothetical protein A4E58_01480 [Syntrophorhabdus sp. PtaB.Bin006]OPY74086.1 MAG: hypothetical protein A4E62_00061 [Syntrophorhabdus sp. PtaU1.Bin002]